jgi:NADH-quinone oxidoreductase subunit N
MMFVSGARDLLVLFLGIETLSIALYVLAGFSRRRFMSNEASLKYFLLGAFAAGFLLYGIALGLFRDGLDFVPQHRGPQFRKARSHWPTARCGGAAANIVYRHGLVAHWPWVQSCTGAVPQWTPDVYEGSPTPVTAFMAVGAKAAAFAGFLHSFPECSVLYTNSGLM